MTTLPPMNATRSAEAARADILARRMGETVRAKKSLRIVGAGNTHIGGREHNEDTVCLRPDLDLYMVADGAGGHNAGNIASALATTSVAHYFESTLSEAATAPPYDSMGLSWAARRLASAFQHANREVLDIASGSQQRQGMGTTLVAASFDLTHGMLVLGHVGDSRCYRMREGRLERLTQDHTLVNDVLELKPDIDSAAAARLPRNVITNALGMEQTLRVSVRTHEVAPGDRYVLCSDGLTDQVDDGEIAQALQLGGAPDEQVRLLIDLATDGGARDNIAVIVLAASLAPGIGKLPEKPIPPRRAYPEDTGAVLAADDEPSVEHEIDADDDEDISVPDAPALAQPQPPLAQPPLAQPPLAQPPLAQWGPPPIPAQPAVIVEDMGIGIEDMGLAAQLEPPSADDLDIDAELAALEPVEDDEPELEIEENKPATDVGKSTRRRRPDETVVQKGGGRPGG
jgi:serine/threonine protein phosphatase PrpC